jgi:hypothetical protein
VHHFVNVLRHNYPGIFDDQTLVGLQFELECLSPADNTVDYEEFARLFLERTTSSSAKEDAAFEKRTTFQIQDYEDLLSKISMHVKQEALDLDRIFKIFAKQGGVITYDHL